MYTILEKQNKIRLSSSNLNTKKNEKKKTIITKKKAAEVDLIGCFYAAHCNRTHGHTHADRYVPALCARHCNDPESGSDGRTDKEDKKGKAKKGGREENQQVTHFVFF